jgi:flagellar assembly protein FliH
MTLSIDAVFAPLDFPAVGRRTDDAASVRGHAAGYAAGRRQAEQELQELRSSIAAEAQAARVSATAELTRAMNALESATAQLRAQELPVLESVDGAIARAAFELAEAIIGHELADGEGSARTAVRRATESSPAAATRIRFNPRDIALMAPHQFAPGLVLVGDETIEPGGAVVEVDNGSIDARVMSALARAKAALVEAAP